MIFADKLITLRKKSGWSQEELAEQMNVSRQSVSKWEGAQSIPDLGKMLRLSELFNVSLDYLLKDEIEETDAVSPTEEPAALRHVSMEDANAFLQAKAATAKAIAFATSLCILSPVCLFILGEVSEQPESAVSENAACGIGLIVLFAFIASAVAVFLTCGSRTSVYEYLETEPIETAYGVTGMVRERQAQYRDTYMKNNLIGTCLCILGVVPLFFGLIINEDNDLLLVSMLCLMFVIISIGVNCFVRVGVIWSSFEKLLQEGDYTREKKKHQAAATAIATTYWCTAVAIYLGISLAANNWHISWVVWPVAGVLYPAVIAIFHALYKNKKD